MALFKLESVEERTKPVLVEYMYMSQVISRQCQFSSMVKKRGEKDACYTIIVKHILTGK